MQSGLALAPGRRVSAAWTVPLLVGLGVYCVALAGARALLNDGDTLSHIAIGRWILAHRAIPFHDPFTFTARGRSWVPHEWLSELVFAVLYDRLGWGGVVAAAGLSAAAAFVLLTRALAMTLGPRRAAIGALAAFALTESHFLARPHVLAWPLLVVWMARVIGARDAGRVPSLLLLPIMILWCNLHGGFVVGLFFAGLLAAEAVLAAPAAGRLAALAGWGTFLACSTLAALVSPNGVSGLLLPFKMLGMKFALASISEWRSADFAGFDPLEAWIGLLILGGFTLAIRLPVSRILMLLLLLWAALVHVRNKELLGIVAPLLLAAPLARQLGPERPSSRGLDVRSAEADFRSAKADGRCGDLVVAESRGSGWLPPERPARAGRPGVAMTMRLSRRGPVSCCSISPDHLRGCPRVPRWCWRLSAFSPAPGPSTGAAWRQAPISPRPRR